MANVSAEGFRRVWIANAASLDLKGHFSKYSTKQREEVLRKGFLGKYSPDSALSIAKQQVRAGYAFRTPKFDDEMRNHFGLVGNDIREMLLTVLAEVPPESYEPPRELNDPPGCPFLFYSKPLKCEIYFKLQINGTVQKPQVLFWSCHPPVY